MAIYKVVKRNWSIVTFDADKIKKAIKNAIISAWGNDFSSLDEIVWDVVILVSQKVDWIPWVEDIQDVVEEVLIKAGHDSVAKKYILYREERRKNRDQKNHKRKKCQNKDISHFGCHTRKIVFYDPCN